MSPCSKLRILELSHNSFPLSGTLLKASPVKNIFHNTYMVAEAVVMRKITSHYFELPSLTIKMSHAFFFLNHTYQPLLTQQKLS